MPISSGPAEIERALVETGNGWILGLGDRDAFLVQVSREIGDFVAAFEARFDATPDPFALLEANPDKGAAFFELYTHPAISMEIRLAVWQLIHGADIESVRFSYDRPGTSELVVVLLIGDRRPTREEFRGDRLSDVEVIRHFGVLRQGESEILDGYYASALPESA